jgi:1-acyl-sn-glycerol-3-phosphate acyltransferase
LEREKSGQGRYTDRSLKGGCVARNEPIKQLVERLELPFNELGYDKYGISKKHLRIGFEALALLYRHYFRVKAFGIENVPRRGRAMLIGNHSGGVAFDGAMVLASMMLEMDPPRLAQGMVEKFLTRAPIASLWSNRTGQFTGLPEHAIQLLEEDRLLMVFPEGARGTAKLYKDRYSLVDFGQGFMRMAMKTKSPIVPFAFLGGGAALPTIANLYFLGKLFGTPYVPLTPYLLPVPLPAQLEVHYGAPLLFEGTGSEDDKVIIGHVDQVKAAVAKLIDDARARRKTAKELGS